MLSNNIFNKKFFILLFFSVITLNVFAMEMDDEDRRRHYMPYLPFMDKGTSTDDSIQIDTKQDSKIKAYLADGLRSMPTRYSNVFKDKKFKPCILIIRNESDNDIILNQEDLFLFKLNLPNDKCLKSLELSSIKRWINKNIPIYKIFVKKTDSEDLLNYIEERSFNLTIYDKEILKNISNLSLKEKNSSNLIIPKKSIAQFIIFLSNDDWSRLNNKQDRLVPRLNFAIKPACDK